MDAMVAAGFSMVFLGIESPNPDALKQTNKLQNTAKDDRDYLLHAVEAIQRKGIEVTGGFILGLDGDGPEVFDAQVAFIQRAGIPIAMVGLLTAVSERVGLAYTGERLHLGGELAWSGFDNDEDALRWQNESGSITAYRGKDLVFVNFELAGYADAVKRKRQGLTLECN